MRKIKFLIPNDRMEYKFTEVTEETYAILERKVIENSTRNIQLQTFLQETKITLSKLMETAITEKMVNDSIKESIDNLKNKML